MTETDTIKMLTILRAAYPHSFKDMTSADTEAMVALWTRLFADDNPAVVSAAIDALIATRTVGYSPAPGEVKEQIRKLKSANELDELSAWALVSKACCNGIYGYKEEYAKLPPEVQRAVGAPEQLREWAMMDSDTVQSVVASNFQRNYRTVQAREREFQKLPSSVASVISGVADHMRLHD